MRVIFQKSSDFDESGKKKARDYSAKQNIER